MDKFRFRILITLTVLTVLMVGYGMYKNYINGRPPIYINTDSVPLTLELNDKVINITKPRTTLHLPPSLYNYQATYGTGKNTIRLYGTVDTVDNKYESIDLRYKIFSIKYIEDALCVNDSVDQTDPCIYKGTIQKITYLADHSWALVEVSVPSAESPNSLIALELEHGAWIKQAGPYSSIDSFKDDLPAKVMKGVE